MDEALNETGVGGRGLVVTGKHWLLLSSPKAGPRLHRVYAQEMFYQPLLTFAQWSESFDTYKESFKTSVTLITCIHSLIFTIYIQR